MKDDAGNRMIGANEAAELYGCSQRYIRRLAAEGRIRSEIVGRTYLVSAADVKKLSSRQDGGRLRKRATGHKPG